MNYGHLRDHPVIGRALPGNPWWVVLRLTEWPKGPVPGTYSERQRVYFAKFGLRQLGVVHVCLPMGHGSGNLSVASPSDAISTLREPMLNIS